MPSRSNIFFKDKYYHIYNRGAGKIGIYLADENYRYCRQLLEDYASKFQISILAFCLMPNHYHLLLRQESDSSISNYIGIAFNAYTQAFNRMYHRSGTLFEGRFKHVVIDTDSSVLQLCRYLHLNPVSANIAAQPEEWEYSDYQEWIGSRSRWRIDKDFISRYFTSGNEYRDFVIGFLREKKKNDEIVKYLFDED